MFTNRAKWRYYIRFCEDGAAFAKSGAARQAFAEALDELKKAYVNKE